MNSLSLKTKIIGIAVAALSLALLIAWGVERIQAQAQARQRAEEAREAWRAKVDQAEADTAALLAQNATLKMESDQWKRRAESPIVVERMKKVLFNVPASCRECLEQYRRELKFKRPGVRVTIPDAIAGDTAIIEIDQDVICRSWKKLAEQSGGNSGALTPSPSMPTPRLIRQGPWLEAGAGYGLAGTDIEIGSWPLEVGSSRFQAQVGIYGQATFRRDGEVDGNAAVGLRLQIR